MTDIRGPVGSDIGGLQVVSALGKGGMGEVYKAFDPSLQRYAAIKLVSAVSAQDPEFVARFEREARSASAIGHPNVAQIFSYGTWEGRPYYVMELVDGRSLELMLDGEERISGRICLGYLIQACEGLREAERHGIIHRDVKPANLMVDRNDRLKIVDFGLARRSTDEALTQSDLILGTPRYMSPEQATSTEVDFRSDIYSLGATFYHLFSGEPPFSAPTPIGVMMKHVQDPLVPLKEKNPRVPEAVCRIIDKMMSKAPWDRQQSYDELIDELTRVLSGRSEITVSPVDPGSRTGTHKEAPIPVSSSSPLRVWLAAAAAVVVIAGLFVILRMSQKLERLERSQAAAEQEVPDPTRKGREESGSRGESPQAPAPTVTMTELQKIAAGIADLSPQRAMATALHAKSLSNMRQLHMAVEMYMAEWGEYPPSLTALAQHSGLHPRALEDAWERPILLRYTPQGLCRIISTGPDGQESTADDIIMEDGYVIQGGPATSGQR